MNTRKALQDAARYLTQYANALRSPGMPLKDGVPCWPATGSQVQQMHDDMLAIAEHLLSLVGKPVAQIKTEAAWPFPSTKASA